MSDLSLTGITASVRRRQRLKQLYRYRWSIGAGVALVILVAGSLGGWWFLRNQERQQATIDYLVASTIVDPRQRQEAKMSLIQRGTPALRLLATHDLIQEFLQDDRPDEALEILRKTENTGIPEPYTTLHRLWKAQAHMALEQWNLAVPILEEIGDGRFFVPIAKFLLAQAYHANTNTNDAIQTLQQLVTNPGASPSLQQRARTLLLALGGDPMPDSPLPTIRTIDDQPQGSRDPSS